MKKKVTGVSEKILNTLVEEYVLGYKWYCYRASNNYSKKDHVMTMRWFMPPAATTHLSHLRLCREPDMVRRPITGGFGIHFLGITNSWIVVNKMRSLGYIFTIMDGAGLENDKWLARFGKDRRYDSSYIYSDTEGVAICVAALASFGVFVTLRKK